MIFSTGTIVPEIPVADNYIDEIARKYAPPHNRTAVTWQSGNGSTSMTLDCNIDTARRLFEQAQIPGVVSVMFEAVTS